MTDFEKEIEVLKEKISELELDLRNYRCEKEDDIEITLPLEECVDDFLKNTQYHYWKSQDVEVYTNNGYSVGVKNFENLEKDLIRHKKEREEDEIFLSEEWFGDNNWNIAYYSNGRINLITRYINNVKFTFASHLKDLYINNEPVPFPITTVGQLKQIISILEES